MTEKPAALGIAEKLTRATVWVSPNATDVHLAGVLIEPDLVLTIAKGMTRGDCVGVAFPVRDGDRWKHERATYRDGIALALRGNWRAARVLTTDRDRDLALLRLDSPVAEMRPLPLASRTPDLASPLHAMSHPAGLEFAWVYASGTVRQRGKSIVALGEKVQPVETLVCQLPTQAGSPGGPVVNDRGELVGVMSRKDATQMVGYAITAEEIAAFLDVSMCDRKARTLRGLMARLVSLPHCFAQAAAMSFAQRAEGHRSAGKLEAAHRDARAALAFDSGCAVARLSLAHMLPPMEALAELHDAVEQGPFNRDVLILRANYAANAKDWRKARGDLERILDVNPADAEARQMLVPVLLELHKDAEAATAVGDTLRADPKRLPAVAKDLLSQAKAMEENYPAAPSVPARWLLKAMSAANRDEFVEVLTSATIAKNDGERLAVLRAGLARLSQK